MCCVLSCRRVHVTIVTDLLEYCNSSYSFIMATDPTLDALTKIQTRMNEMPVERAKLIEAARAAGKSWPAIGRALGMSHVGAMKAAKVTPN